MNPDWLTMDKKERDEMLRAFAEKGMSAGEMSLKFLNASRNAVIGRITRMNPPCPHFHNKAGAGRKRSTPKPSVAKTVAKLLPPDPPEPERIVAILDEPITFAAPVAPPASSHVHPGNIVRAAAARKSDPGLKLPASMAFDPLPGTSPVALTELRLFGQCRWPVGGLDAVSFYDCGEPCGIEESYCGVHRTAAYQKRPAGVM